MGRDSKELLDLDMDGAGNAHEHTGGTCSRAVVAHLSGLSPGHSTPVPHVDPP